jgi:pentatricopeptide repeat protein
VTEHARAGLEAMQEAGLRPDTRSFNNLLGSYRLLKAEGEMNTEAEGVLNMLAEGAALNDAVDLLAEGAAFYTRAALGGGGGAVVQGDAVDRPAVDTSLARLMMRLDHRRDAEAVLEEMRTAGCTPNAYTASIMLDVYNKLEVPAHTRLDLVRELCVVDGLQPNAVILNTLLAPFAAAGDGRGAFSMAEKLVGKRAKGVGMSKTGRRKGLPRIVPDGLTMVLLVNACSKSRKVAKETAPLIYEWLGDGTTGSGRGRVTPSALNSRSLHIFTALVQHASRAGDLDQAWRWFEQLKARGGSSGGGGGGGSGCGGKVDAVALNMLATAFALASGDFAKAPEGHVARLLNEHKAARIPLDIASFNTLLFALTHATVALDRNKEEEEGEGEGVGEGGWEGVGEGEWEGVGDKHGSEEKWLEDWRGEKEGREDEGVDKEDKEGEEGEEGDSAVEGSAGGASEEQESPYESRFPMPQGLYYAPTVPPERHWTTKAAKVAVLALATKVVGRMDKMHAAGALPPPGLSTFNTLIGLYTALGHLDEAEAVSETPTQYSV